MAKEPGLTYAMIAENGGIVAVTSRSAEWQDNFARHHRVAWSAIGPNGGGVSTVFLGCGRLGEDGVVRGAFETHLINADGTCVHEIRADTAAQALRNHRALAR